MNNNNNNTASKAESLATSNFEHLSTLNDLKITPEPGTNSPATEKLPVLAVDVDEVLAQFLAACNKWYNATYGENFKVTDYESYHFCDTWGCTDGEALERVYEFFGTSYFEEIEPVAGAYESLELLSRYFRLAVVTSRQLFLEQSTRDWLKKHFPKISFSYILFGNQWITPQANAQRISKKDFCKAIGAVALIDDLPKYILDSASVLKTAVLFNNGNNQKWSRITDAMVAADHVPENIVTCTSWSQICGILIELSTGQAELRSNICSLNKEEPNQSVNETEIINSLRQDNEESKSDENNPMDKRDHASESSVEAFPVISPIQI